MTAKPKPVDPWPIQATPRADTATRQSGISQELVYSIYNQVLSGEPVKSVEPLDRTSRGQFNKGISGNPKGRPKREEPAQAVPPAALATESLSAIVRRQGARTIKAQTDQGEVELTIVEAAVTKMTREALKGNTGHSRTLLQLVGRGEAEEAKRKREEFRYWSAAKEQAAQLYLQAEQAGEAPPLSVHPDDIELYADGTVAIVGPETPGDIAVMRRIHSKVDYHIVNIAYQQWVERRWIRSHRGRIEGVLYAELDLWDEQNDLPPRLKMTVEELNARLHSYARYSGRVLHGFLRGKAQPHGQYVPPREMRIPLIVPATVLKFAKDNSISLRQLLPMWLAGAGKLADAKLDGPSAASQTTPSP